LHSKALGGRVKGGRNRCFGRANNSIAYYAFREPPWSGDLEKTRLQRLGVDLMRRNAAAYIARTYISNLIMSYMLGYEIVRMSKDHRYLMLGQISGANSLDYLFDGCRRVFDMGPDRTFWLLEFRNKIA
jgi:hypothetical protein